MSAQAKSSDWFSVDKDGLAKLLSEKSPAFILFELFQNVVDTAAKNATIEFHPIVGKPFCELTVMDDDPDGFSDLRHAWTLFAESQKKSDPTKRGRFNLGEKLVLALCVEAEIVTTTGGVHFDGEGRHTLRRQTQQGSVFHAKVRMTRAEHQKAMDEFKIVIVPKDVTLTVNGQPVRHRTPVATFEAKLPTVIADEEGFLKRSIRTTTVDIYDSNGCDGMLFELGIPVVTTGDKFDYDVRQKVPLTVDRDNVPPSYLKELRALALNATAHLLDKVDASKPWVQEAAGSDVCSPEANERVLTLQFGKKRAILDPSDPEANKELMNRGYTIISGGALSADRWNNVRRDGIAVPSGRIAPSGTRHAASGRPERVVDPADYTVDQRRVVDFTQDLAFKLIARHIHIQIVSETIALPHSAWYGNGHLTFNVGRLGKHWFEEPLGRMHLELIVHELSHDKVSDHLTREFADEVGRLAAKALDLALKDPDFFTTRGWQSA